MKNCARAITCQLLLSLLACFFLTAPVTAQTEIPDPLAPILQPVLESTVAQLLAVDHQRRRYNHDDFPLEKAKFDTFRQQIVEQITRSTGLAEWIVRKPQGKQNALAGKFRDRLLKRIEHYGVRMEIHLIEIPETGDRIPAVVCLPSGEGPHPAVCCFSGHTRHGLRDLVLDLESYQRGIAVRLAKAGFATIAVEKLDTGYLARSFGRGVDEPQIASHRLALGHPTRGHQLRACLAATEILATHPQVDETRIGATGVSLGGWLSIETGLLTDRLAAVADFGRKTVFVPDGLKPQQFSGITDLCHIMPGLLSLADRNIHALAWAPRPLLAGHGRQDTGSHQQGPIYFERIYAAQYRALGHASDYHYHVHDGGDTMPEQVVIEYFQKVFARQ